MPQWTSLTRESGPRLAVGPFELGVVALTALALLLPGLWSHTLIDPWEGHYAEVARRILEENDWVLLRWQDEYFQSKPVLSFWLMAASMEIFGVAEGGGYSGEMLSSPVVILALRLPFALFGAFGLVITWYALARLASRRVAWIALVVLATSPFYFFIARQAITDMPMVACLMGALACFALAIDDEASAPIRPFWGRMNGVHIFLAVVTLGVGGQALYYLLYFLANPDLARGIEVPAAHLFLSLPMLVALAALWVWALRLQPVTTRRQLLMLWFYLLLGVSVLAKGPPAVAIAGGTCLFYLVVTGKWRLLLEVEIPRGILLAAAVALPWHIAMFFKAGMPYYNEYVQQHLLNRAAQGVHGDQGTFNYFASQLGIGMWPWAGLIPAAVAAVSAGGLSGREGRLRLVVGLWAVTAVALFCLVQTKYHHYIFPAVPALAILVAFFIDDTLRGRVCRPALASLVAVGVILLVGRDLIGEQKQLIELFIYRYTRPWPSDPPWNVDVGPTLARFAALFALGIAAFGCARLRARAFAFLPAVALFWAYWGMNGYMSAAAPHWGQGALHQTYYQERAIHGVEIHYRGLRQLAEDWSEDAGDYKVRSVLPDTLHPGDAVTARITPPGRKDPIELEGEVSRLGDDAFWIHIPDEQREKIRHLLERARHAPESQASPWIQVDADRLHAWQLNWRSENFWSGGEIWGHTDETRTVWNSRTGRDPDAFQDYFDEHGREGQTYFVITQAGSQSRLRGALPTGKAKETLEVRDNSCNKFTLFSFTL